MTVGAHLSKCQGLVVLGLRLAEWEIEVLVCLCRAGKWPDCKEKQGL